MGISSLAEQNIQVAQDGLSGGVWGIDRMVSNKGWTYFTLPSCLAPGNYLLRGTSCDLTFAALNSPLFLQPRPSLFTRLTPRERPNSTWLARSSTFKEAARGTARTI
jgi:hypothetical protein